MNVTPSAAVRVHVDAWDPGYGTALGRDMATAGQESTARVNVNVERRADDWAPVPVPHGIGLPEHVYVVDGVRRIEANVWFEAADFATPTLGLAASWAAGVVRLDGSAQVVAATVKRAVFTAFPEAVRLDTSAGSYPAKLASENSPEALVLALQEQLLRTEAEVSEQARGDDDQALLVVDGPLLGRVHLPATIGFIKTHQAVYLPPELSRLVGSLAPGERTPVFTIGTTYSRHTWYLRLPGGTSAPWSGVVRCEASSDLGRDEVVALAEVTAALLPTLASQRHKDPRAPQNLLPIGGLERHLRHLLGDSRLLHRALVAAAAS